MPKISDFAAVLPQSAIRMLTPYADRAEAEGIKVYHLNIGAPDIKSPESAVAAVHGFRFDHLPYSNSAGTAELRRDLVEKYYRKIGIDITTDDILVTVAGSEAIMMMFQCICNEGDEVLVFEPFYCNYNAIAKVNRVRLIGIHTDIHDDFALPDPSIIERYITPRTKAILICNPSNPTGTLYSRDKVLSIAEICRKHDLYLIADEVYREFCYTDAPHFSIMQIPDFSENAILLDSASKRYNLCGARIGVLVSRNKEVIRLATKLAQARLCPPVLGQVALSGALDAGPDYFSATRKEYIARRNYTIAALNDIPGVYSPLPYGAFYTIAELPVRDAGDFCKWLLTDFRPGGETVMLTPAEAFYSTPGIGLNQVRIAYVLEVPELKKAMGILRHALDTYNKMQ